MSILWPSLGRFRHLSHFIWGLALQEMAKMVEPLNEFILMWAGIKSHYGLSLEKLRKQGVYICQKLQLGSWLYCQ